MPDNGKRPLHAEASSDDQRSASRRRKLSKNIAGADSALSLWDEAPTEMASPVPASPSAAIVTAASGSRVQPSRESDEPTTEAPAPTAPSPKAMPTSDAEKAVAAAAHRPHFFPEEAAAIAGMSVSWICLQCRLGKIPGAHKISPKRWVIPKDGLYALLCGRPNPWDDG